MGATNHHQQFENSLSTMMLKYLHIYSFLEGIYLGGYEYEFIILSMLKIKTYNKVQVIKSTIILELKQIT